MFVFNVMPKREIFIEKYILYKILYFAKKINYKKKFVNKIKLK